MAVYHLGRSVKLAVKLINFFLNRAHLTLSISQHRHWQNLNKELAQQMLR